MLTVTPRCGTSIDMVIKVCIYAQVDMIGEIFHTQVTMTVETCCNIQVIIMDVMCCNTHVDMTGVTRHTRQVDIPGVIF